MRSFSDPLQKSGPSQKACAFFPIATQFENLGDALIIRELLILLRERAALRLYGRGVPAEFLDMVGRDILDGIPLARHKRYGFFLLGILARALGGRRCYLFLGPGAQRPPRLRGCRDRLCFGLTVVFYALLRRAGVRICRIGVSYTESDEKENAVLRVMSHHLSFHYVRDTGSVAILRQAGVAVDGICPDLAFRLFDGTGPVAENPDAVTFSFRTDQYPGQEADVKRFIDFFVSVCGTVRPVYFVAQVRRDIAPNAALAAWMSARHGIPVVMTEGASSIEATRRLYRRSNVMVSNRLHSLLLAGSVGNAMIAAGLGAGTSKIRDLFRDAGLAGHVFESGAAHDGDRAARLGTARGHRIAGTAQRRALEDCMGRIFAVRALY